MPLRRCMGACMHACVRACMRACVRARPCINACAHGSMGPWEGPGERLCILAAMRVVMCHPAVHVSAHLQRWIWHKETHDRHCTLWPLHVYRHDRQVCRQVYGCVHRHVSTHRESLANIINIMTIIISYYLGSSQLNVFRHRRLRAYGYTH